MIARILCIEDEPGLGDDLLLELEDAGYSADLATDGEAGLAALGRQIYDLVLCDVQIPVLNGLEVLAAGSATGPGTPPFIMLTAYSDRVLRDRCLAGGARHVLVKPVDYAELLTLIAQELGQ